MIAQAVLILARAKSWLSRWRPEILALVAVIAVSGIGAAILGSQLIKAQRDRIAAQSQRITDLTEINKGWKKWADEEAERNQRGHEDVLAVQAELEALRQQAAINEKQLARLEEVNEEVRAYLSQPLPGDLKRMLK